MIVIMTHTIGYINLNPEKHTQEVDISLIEEKDNYFIMQYNEETTEE